MWFSFDINLTSLESVTDITSEHINYMKSMGRIEKMLVDVGWQMLMKPGDDTYGAVP